MRIEFWFRTYSTYGGSVTLNLAGSWISKRLKYSYGGKINSVLIELCCKNVSPPRKTLESNHERFEEFLGTLPRYETSEKGTELRISYRAIKYTHDEIDRDSQVIALKEFGKVLRKAVILIEPADLKLKSLGGFNSEQLAKDISEALSECPSTLLELTELYAEQQHKKT